MLMKMSGMQVKMAQSKWGEIDYERVASCCMKMNKGLFTKHDKERFMVRPAPYTSLQCQLSIGLSPAKRHE